MKIFKNGVGRPSNETLRKRKIFISVCVVFAIGIITAAGLLVNNLTKAKASLGTISLANNAKRTVSVRYQKNANNSYSVDGVVEISRTGNKINSILYRRGDVNLDGNVNKTDSELILRHVTGAKKLTGAALALADINNDGKVSTVDAKNVTNKTKNPAGFKNYKTCIAKSSSQCKWSQNYSNKLIVTTLSSSGTYYLHVYDTTNNKVYSNFATIPVSGITTTKAPSKKITIKKATTKKTTTKKAAIKDSASTKRYSNNTYNVRYKKLSGNEYAIDGELVIKREENDITAMIQKRGDVSLDGVINEVDAYYILQHIAGTHKLSAALQKLADVNNDGKVTVVDAKKVLQQAQNPGGFKNYKVCVAPSADNCIWETIGLNAANTRTITKPGTYYVHVYDVDNNKIYKKFKEIKVDNLVKIDPGKSSLKMVPVYGDNNIPVTSSFEGLIAVKNTKIKSITSSNKKVAVVKLTNKGTDGYAKYSVKPIRNGVTRITATTTDGKTDSIGLTVTPQYEKESQVFGNNKYTVDNSASNVTIFKENTCQNADRIISAIKKLPSNVQQATARVYLLNGKTYVSKYGADSSALASSLDYILINCEQTGGDETWAKSVVTHEFGHAMDSYYQKITGEVLHNKTGNNSAAYYFKNKASQLKQNKIISESDDYGYTNIFEFFAELHAGYGLRNYFNLSKNQVDNSGLKLEAGGYNLYNVISNEVNIYNKAVNGLK